MSILDPWGVKNDHFWVKNDHFGVKNGPKCVKMTHVFRLCLYGVRCNEFASKLCFRHFFVIPIFPSFYYLRMKKGLFSGPTERACWGPKMTKMTLTKKTTPQKANQKSTIFTTIKKHKNAQLASKIKSIFH
jgi:hypothetical protein